MIEDPKKTGIPRASILLLAGALILIGHEAWFGGDGDSSRASPARAAGVRLDSASVQRPPRGPEPVKAADTSGWLPPIARTPPRAPVPPTIDEVLLQRIVHDPRDREVSFAVISGWAIRAGEIVGDLGVEAIEADRVVLMDGTELRLP